MHCNSSRTPPATPTGFDPLAARSHTTNAANGFELRTGDDAPVVTAALHDGHAVRADTDAAFALASEQRLREEDPFTAMWTDIVDTRLIALRSRFEVDLNRPRERAIYLQPEDAWGLQVWKAEPTAGQLARSLAQYDAFYAAAHALLARMCRRWGRFVVLDLHSYNHRRDGAGLPPADASSHPEVNLGTSNMDRARWAPVVDRVLTHLASTEIRGHTLDVRENVKFKGGHFAQWVHRSFPRNACTISLEFRKSFMDEWTGEPDLLHVRAIRGALAALVPEVVDALQDVRD
jgi:N-formylglutamate deformylase